MAKLMKYSLSGKKVGEIELEDALFEAEANHQMIKDYIVALRANARQWSANTKTRRQVAHTTKKPHPQKGTGRARQGSLVSPQFRGGGRAHGPKPKFDQHVRINRKERRAAIRSLIAEKLRENKVWVLDSIQLDEPKTQTVAKFLNAQGIEGRTLFLTETPNPFSETKPHQAFVLSVRNIPGSACHSATQISGYDLLVARQIVLSEAALGEVVKWLS